MIVDSGGTVENTSLWSRLTHAAAFHAKAGLALHERRGGGLSECGFDSVPSESLKSSAADAWCVALVLWWNFLRSLIAGLGGHYLQ